MEIIHLATCPLCGSTNIAHCLMVKDHTVSGESFEIMHCSNCSGRFTQDIPSAAYIGKYYQSSDYISHTDTREGFVNKLYHRIRKITLNQKKRLIEQVTSRKKGKLLDVGAGIGLFVQTMRQAEWEVIGLEPDAGARQLAANMKIKLDDPATLFTLPDASFDAITLWHVLEHVHELHQYLDQCRKLLAASGKLIVAVPNYTSADAKHYGSNWAAYDVPRHLYHFSPIAMQMLMNKHDFKLVKTYPQWFDSFYVSLLSEQYKTGKSKLLKGAWEGMMSNFKTVGNRERCSSLIYICTQRR